MHEIDRSILTTQSPETSSQSVVNHLRKLLPCERASVTLLDFESQKVIIIAVASDEETGELSRGKHIPLDTFDNAAEMLELLRGGEAKLVPDLQELSLGSPSTQEVLAKGFRSSLSVPIVIQDELIGILNLLAYKPSIYTSEHVEIAREVAGHLGITIQQARLFDQLSINREQLQALSQRLLEIQEAERRKIARELHDEVGQVLTGVRLTLEMSSQVSNDNVGENIRQAHALVVELMERVSRLSLELRPALLDDLGLLPTLLWFLDRYFSQTNVRVIFKHSGLENRRFVPEIETAAYRIVQESLTNVARHAKAKDAKLALWFDHGVLGIQIEDEGIGFNQDAVLSAGYAGGILGMRERVSLLCGKLTIESVEGLGTRLLAEIPVDASIIKGID
jgi:signal transduction histidine kinase